MANVDFKDIPDEMRVPGVYAEFNTENAVNSLGAGLQKMVLVAQKLATAPYTATAPIQVDSDGQAADLFGRGSQAHLLVREALTANAYLQLNVLPVADDSAAVAATGTIKFTGPATSVGQNSIAIGTVRISAAVTNAQTATSMASKLKAAIDANRDLPVTASVATDTITLTAKNKGTIGNEVMITASTTATGVTVDVTAMKDGAGDPDMAAALATIFGSGYDVIAIPYATSEAVTALRDFIASVSGPLEQRGATGVVGCRGTLSEAVTLATSVNDGRVTLAWYNGSILPNGMIAAGYAAVIASQDDPAKPYDNLPIAGLDVTTLDKRPSRTEEEAALWSGVTPLKVGPGNQVQIVRAISTYTTSPDGAQDPSLLDITTIRSLDYVRQAIDTRLKLRFPQAKNSPRIASSVRSEILAVLYQLQDEEIVENVDTYKDGVIVKVDDKDPSRLNCIIPANVISGLHIIAARIDLYL